MKMKQVFILDKIVEINSQLIVRTSSFLKKIIEKKIVINPLQPGVAFLYPLKTSENLKVV